MVESSVIIRPGTVDDAEAFRDVRLEALRTSPTAFGVDYESAAQHPMERWIERVQPSEYSTVLFAVADTQLVGMCGIYRDTLIKTRHIATIWAVYVRPEWRGQGLAQRLVNAAMDWARDHAVRRVSLCAVTTNAAAIGCYLKCGFTVYGVDAETLYYDGVYYDELLMGRVV